MWGKELKEATHLAQGHISLYQLTIEPGTEFYKKRVGAANETVGAALYETTQEIMNKANLPAYEISNHAKKGAESLHNLIYWTGGDYLGIGPGAHGRITQRLQTDMMHNYRDPGKWLNLAITNNFGGQKREKLSDEQRRDELVLMGLRLIKGISLHQFELLTGQPLTKMLDKNKVNILTNQGYLSTNGGFFKATSSGRQRLNAIITYLLT